MKLYSKKGEIVHELITGLNLQISEAEIIHKQKQITNGSKRARMEAKKEQAFNVAASFEKRDARNLERKKRRELARRKK